MFVVNLWCPGISLLQTQCSHLVRLAWSCCQCGIAESIADFVVKMFLAVFAETGLPVGVRTIVESQVNSSAEFLVPFLVVSREVLIGFPLIPKVFVAEVVLAFLPYFHACALLSWVRVVEQFLPFVRRALVVVAHGP